MPATLNARLTYPAASTARLNGCAYDFVVRLWHDGVMAGDLERQSAEGRTR